MNRYIPAIITGFAVTPLIMQQVLAQPSNLYQQARQSVVLIQNETGGRQGTGFIVSGGNGTYSVLTAGHVVQERRPSNAQLRIVTVTGETIPVVAEVIPGRDLALLQFRSTQEYRAVNILPSNVDDLSLPTRIFVLGYPATGGREPEILGGNISSRQPSQSGGISIFHTAPTVGGMSGSPVLTERGEVVGIHVGRTEQGGVREAIPLDQEKYKQIVSSIVIRLARNNLEAGNYAEAITSIEQGIRQGILSNSAETDAILAYAYFAQGNNEEARRVSRRISSSNANAALLLGAISYITGDYINAMSNANEVVKLDNRNLGNYALAIIGLSESAGNPSPASLLSANSNTERAVRSLPSSAFINFAYACVRRRSLDNEGSARFANQGNININRPLTDPFLSIVIPRLQETVIKDCLDNLPPPPPPSQFGRYRITESINLESGATAIATSRDNQFVAVGMRNGTVSVYNLQTRSRTGIFSSGQPNTAISSVAFSPNGQEIAIASGSGEVRIFNIRSERQRYSIDGGVNPLIVFRDNSSLFVGNRNGTLKIVRDQQTIVAENHDGGISSIALSPNSNFLVSGGVNGTIRLWNAADLTPVDNYQAHQREVQRLAFSSDGNQLISAGLDDVIASCDWRTKQCSEIARSREGINSLAVASNGHVAFAKSNFIGSGDNRIFLQDPRSGQSLGELEGHTGQVNALAYTSDSQTFVSGGDDRTLIIWEVQ